LAKIAENCDHNIDPGFAGNRIESNIEIAGTASGILSRDVKISAFLLKPLNCVDFS
jgi:hypothetical protein